MRIVIDHDARTEIVIPRNERPDPEVLLVRDVLAEVEGLRKDAEQIAPEDRAGKIERLCDALIILKRRLALEFESGPPSVPPPKLSGAHDV